MDITYLNYYLQQLLYIIALLDPTVSLDEVSNMPPPQIETVSIEYYIDNICICECDESHIYGRFFLDSNDVPTLLVTTPNGGDIPIFDPMFDALMIHELTHYVQFKQGKYNGLLTEGSLSFSEDDIDKMYQDAEIQAYAVQNSFLERYGFHTFDAEKRIIWSTSLDEDDCVK